jgi:hypothetical protein
MRTKLIIILSSLLLASCVSDSKKELFSSTASEVQLRGFQSRAFDTTDREKNIKNCDCYTSRFRICNYQS